MTPPSPAEQTAGIGSSAPCNPECRRSANRKWMDELLLNLDTHTHTHSYTKRKKLCFQRCHFPAKRSLVQFPARGLSAGSLCSAVMSAWVLLMLPSRLHHTGPFSFYQRVSGTKTYNNYKVVTLLNSSLCDTIVVGTI